ncbi:MAG: P-II family nitrogen regulator [Acidobacteria bacterium]|jgi:nitrogen regulatory protein P-II 1|nr:P-II family nitrogen regulator [Acidobacteriota bacterium]
MREIKAYIRVSKVDDVIRTLRKAGAPGITVTRVHGVGYGYEPYLFTLAPSELKKTAEVAKLEVVCEEDCADHAAEVIVQVARTGDPGDGIVFTTPVERAVKIRTGDEDSRALQASAGSS